MKPWFSLTIVCWALLCLLLSLSQQAGLNQQLQAADSGPWLHRSKRTASGSPTLTPLVLDGVWIAGNLGPPGQKDHGPPKAIGICRLPVKAGSSKQHRATLLHEIIDSTDKI